MTTFFDRARSALADRYALEREIGSGAGSFVYLAEDLRHHRKVAVKILRPELTVAVAVDRFLREIEILAALNNPNIVPLFDSGRVDDVVFFVMPFIEGESLEIRLARDGPFPVAEAIRVACEIAEALSYAHEKGVVHRDIKPANVLLSGDHALLSDFGIARALDRSALDPETTAGLMAGTPVYMSPEQAAPGGDVDPRSDLYSLGCVLFEMLGGQPPFRGRTPQAIAARHLSEPPPPLSTIRPSVSKELDTVVRTALAKAPADRFVTAEGFLAALRAVGLQELKLQDSPRAAVRRLATLRGLADAGSPKEPIPPPGGLKPVPRRYILLAVALFALGAVGVFLIPRLVQDPVILDPNRVAVFPLVIPEGDAVPPSTGEDLATVIGHALDGTGPLRWTDGWSLLDAEQRRDARTLSLADARALAMARECGSLITGRMVVRGDSADVFLSLYDVSGDSVLVRSDFSGLTDSAWRLGIRAANGLLPTLTGAEAPDFGLGFLERDLTAVAQFLLAESSVRRARYEEALDHYRGAFGEDPTFGLAALRGAQAASWLHESEEAARLIERALELPLSQRDRYFAEGVRGYFEGRADDAVEALQSALRLDPHMAVAHFQLGEVYTHLLPTSYGADSAKLALQRARNLDPSAVNSLYHLIEISIRRGELDEGRKTFELFSAESPESWVLDQMRIMLECAEHGPGSVDWVQAVLSGDPHAVMAASTELSFGGAHLACSEAGYRALLAHDTTTEGYAGRRWNALMSLQSVLAVQGQLEEAGELIHAATSSPEELQMVAGGESLPSSRPPGESGGPGSAGATDETGAPDQPCGPPIDSSQGVPGSEHFYLMDSNAGLGFHEMAEQVACQARERFGESYEGTSNANRLWFMGNWEASKGNLEAVVRIAEHMRGALETSGTPRKDSLLTRAMDANVALLKGEREEAMALLLNLRPSGRGNDLLWHFAEPLAPSRMQLARLLLEDGKNRQAHQVAEGFDGNATAYLVYVPESLEIRVRAAQAMGRTNDVARYRERLRKIRGGGAGSRG